MHDTDLNTAVTAALDWWRGAGVDHAFVDDPQDWLAQVRQEASAAKPAPMKPLRELKAERNDSPVIARVPDRSAWPQTLADFSDWWLTEPALAPVGLKRLVPSGPAGASLMILVPMPDRKSVV